MKQRAHTAYLVLFLITPHPVLKCKKPEQAPHATIIHREDDTDFDSTPLVLQNFGGMLTSFLNLVLTDPEDPKNVLQCVSDMVQGMVNIGTIGMRKGYLESDYLYTFEQELAQELIVFLQSEAGKEFLLAWRKNLQRRTRSLNHS